MKILFVDHADHLKTHSADFFVEILRKSFDVETFYYEKTYQFTLPQDKVDSADVIVFWEFLYNRRDLGIPGKRCVFVPMYDNEWGSKWQWKRIAASGMPIISFCDAITTHARAQGVKNILDVRYFPNPADFPQDDGDARRVFLWERGEIGEAEAKRLFPTEAGFVFDIKRSGEFLERTEYFSRLSKCGIVIAPRRKEGIGMAFLEAMAMGKCVVANDDATMNEYITDGVDGILRDFRKPLKAISAMEVKKVLANVKSTAESAQSRWNADRGKIRPFLESATKLPPLPHKTLIDYIRYALFLFEGLRYRLATMHSATFPLRLRKT